MSFMHSPFILQIRCEASVLFIHLNYLHFTLVIPFVVFSLMPITFFSECKIYFATLRQAVQHIGEVKFNYSCRQPNHTYLEMPVRFLAFRLLYGCIQTFNGNFKSAVQTAGEIMTISWQFVVLIVTKQVPRRPF